MKIFGVRVLCIGSADDVCECLLANVGMPYTLYHSQSLLRQTKIYEAFNSYDGNGDVDYDVDEKNKH